MVLVAVPHTGDLKTELARTLISWSGRDDVELYFNEARPVDVNRNKIANYFMDETEHEYLLMVDSDVLPPENVFEVLDYGKDVISPVVFSLREGNPYPVALVESTDEGLRQYGGDVDSELLEVEALGTGCIFISRRVFEEVERPFFSFEKNDEGGNYMGEDLGFCVKASEKGFQPFVATEYSCGHVSEVDLRNYMRLLKVGLETDKSQVFMQEVGGSDEE